MKELIISLFGEFVPVVTFVDDAHTQWVMYPDAAWIAGVVLFGVVLLSLFRLVGVLLKS